MLGRIHYGSYVGLDCSLLEHFKLLLCFLKLVCEDKLQSCSLWNKNHIHRKIDKMKRQRAIYQMKEQKKTPEKQLNEVEIGNLPEKEFRIMIVKMIQDLGKRMEAKIKKMQEMFNKDQKN